MGPRIAIVGGGSTHWTPRLLLDFANTGPLQDAEVVLMDLDAGSLPVMLDAASRIAKRTGSALSARATTDLGQALEGADFVVAAFSVGGFDSMVHDIEIPARYGVRQPVGDSVGPGGVARALRSVPALLEVARAMEARCPDALLINVSNPLSALCRAATSLTSVATVGLCNEVVGQQFALSLLLGRDMREMDQVVAGVNHLPLVTSLSVGEEDGFELIRSTLASLDEVGHEPVWIDPPKGMHYRKLSPGRQWTRADIVHNNRIKLTLFERFGVLPFASDTHIAEFFPHFVTEASDFGRDWGVHHYGVAGHRRDKEEDDEGLAELLSSEEVPPWPSGELVAPLIASVVADQGRALPVNLPNSGQVANLPHGPVVECMGVASRRGVEPRDSVEVPSVLGECLRRVVASQELTVQAALSGDRDAVLAAMMCDPMASRLAFDALEAMTDELLAATAAWLPQFGGRD
ncbi:MAG TPA: hypothetical protein VKY15_05820 [Acidimicrobiales bacterium]|jgi:alpha-galactosidase|nr:hypothetical protein [Acidimicrobiales bacterium]